MKVPVRILAMFGLAALSPAGLAQTNPPAAEAEASGPALAATNGPALAATNGPALAATNGPALAATNGPALAATNGPAPAAADARAFTASNGPSQRGPIIPLIIMDEVPLTDAIENLARQAGLNYLMDPKVGFGQPGADGHVVPQPSVTIRWENISAEQALYALLANHNLQIVEDARSRIARVTNRDPAALPPLSTRVIQLRYAGPTNILLNVRAALTDKRGVVLADLRTSQLVVIATDADMENVERLVERLDAPTKQVLIEARLMETTVNPSTSKGVDWTGTLQGQNIYFGNGTMGGASSAGGVGGGSSSIQTSPGGSSTITLPGGRVLNSSGGSSTTTVLDSLLGTGGMAWNTAGGFSPATGFLNADGVHAVLSFLNTYTETKLLDCPRTVTLDNELAIIEVGTLFPIVNTTAGTANTAGGSQITYSNLTVRLEVTPRISANHYVQLKVRPQILRLGDSVKTTVGDQVNIVYEFNTRDIRTSVMIPSGNTLVMGGLVEDEIQKGNTKVPILGDIPGLGLLFRSDTKNRTKSNLIMFLTPTIIEEKDFQPTKSRYLKTPVPTKDSLEADWGAWNSGEPKRWTKPKPDPATSESDDNAEPKPVTKPKTESPTHQFDENAVPPPSPRPQVP